MKWIFTALLMVSLEAGAQTQQQVDKIKSKDYINAIIKNVGNKRIVALGEDTHGTAEFYELRAAITKRLIEEKGFTTLVLENPHEDMQAVQDSLQHTSLDSLMRRHLFSIYQTRQMKEFLAWLKGQARKKIKLAGCDDSYRELLPEMMMESVQKLKLPVLLNPVTEFKERQVKGGDPDIKYGLATYTLLNRIDSLYQNQKKRDAKFEELLFHAKTAYIFYYRFSRKEAVSRDEIMGERISYYAKDPNQKIIVWAHSGHIAKYAWLQDELGLMGATVYKYFPKDYFAIGLSSANGHYSYITNRFINGDHVFDDTLHTTAFRETKDSSWNQLLAQNKSKSFVLDLTKITKADSAAFAEPRKLRIQGYRKESATYNEFYPICLPRMYDMILFLRNTTATDGLFK
ncbi:erythromycin esterase family protein [Sediminibacterium roseum]|uniref:Erythromycin esterase family protein n=1 Tax=Sediminibacterium roseum TaxID=1978412 RepID=A0ABW9ZW04_9BACT|nr:erythromycin esterase family protein [Sediminibacterium roseum]NCI51347.1 erythromycin esterase family protein [Sediminibacterium roseum]